MTNLAMACTSHPFLLFLLLILVLVGPLNLATTLKVSVELRELRGPQENVRRWLLDLVRFAMLIVVVCGALIISLYVPSIIDGKTVKRWIDLALLIVAYGLIGIFILYVFGLLLMGSRWRKTKDKEQFADPAALDEVATKYAREGRQQQIPKPPCKLQRSSSQALSVVLGCRRCFSSIFFVRFWFNVGTLGNIPTILSAPGFSSIAVGGCCFSTIMGAHGTAT